MITARRAHGTYYYQPKPEWCYVPGHVVNNSLMVVPPWFTISMASWHPSHCHIANTLHWLLLFIYFWIDDTVWYHRSESAYETVTLVLVTERTRKGSMPLCRLCLITWRDFSGSSFVNFTIKILRTGRLGEVRSRYVPIVNLNTTTLHTGTPTMYNNLNPYKRHGRHRRPTRLVTVSTSETCEVVNYYY